MKKFTVSFKRKAVYEEEGYITIEAANVSAAKRIATEILEEGKDPCDYEGDVTDAYFVASEEPPQIDANVEIIEVEKDDFIDEWEDETEEDDDYYDDEDDEFMD